MPHLRTIIGSFFFMIFFWMWLLSLSILGLPLLLAPRRYAYQLVRFWGRGVLKALQYLCGITYTLEGLNHLPAAPFILASKHQSAFETIALYTHLENLVVVLKKELLWIPFYGWYVAKMRMIPIDRTSGVKSLRKMLKRTDEAAARKQTILIFPEGTRTRPHDAPAYKPGIAAIYHHLHQPVVPVSLNSGLFWGKKQWIKNKGHIRIVFHAPIPPHLPKQEFIEKLQNTIETGCKDLYSQRHESRSHQS
jgi:1-acyl-sn-glycerol-3-phosphate acyltransferase